MSMHMHADLKHPVDTYHPCPLVQPLHNRTEQRRPAAVQKNMFVQMYTTLQATQVLVQCNKRQDSMILAGPMTLCYW